MTKRDNLKGLRFRTCAQLVLCYAAQTRCSDTLLGQGMHMLRITLRSDKIKFLTRACTRWVGFCWTAQCWLTPPSVQCAAQSHDALSHAALPVIGN